VANNKIQLIQILVEAGADINCLDNDIRTPLHYANFGGYGEIAFKLLCMGANPNIVDKYGMNAIDYAMNYRCERTMRDFFGEIKPNNSETGRMKFNNQTLCNSLYDRRRDLLHRSGKLLQSRNGNMKFFRELAISANDGGQEARVRSAKCTW
jgi:hypothetical protein